MKIIKFLPLFLITPVFTSACSHAPKNSEPETATHNSNSPKPQHHIEISYILGHNVYQYISDATDQEITLKFSLDHQLVNQRVIQRIISSEPSPQNAQSTNREKILQTYSLWTTKVQEFMTTRAPASDLSVCRSPYSVTFRAGKLGQSDDVNTVRGCRTGNEGSTLSRIARDADFILYSPK